MKRLVPSLAALSAAAALPTAALAQATETYPGYPGYGQHMMWNGGWFGWVVGALAAFLFLGAVVALIVLLIRSLGAGHHGQPARHSALDILKERYARGEIDRDEYEERRRVLNG